MWIVSECDVTRDEQRIIESFPTPAPFPWPPNRDTLLGCSVAFSVISLICSDFISVLLCGDLVPSLESGEPMTASPGERKEPNGEPEREATGVPRVCEWRDGVQEKARGNPGMPRLDSVR
jgi:hypothetical protein